MIQPAGDWYDISATANQFHAIENDLMVTACDYDVVGLCFVSQASTELGDS
ncbi:hypothetical protein [Shewanella sp. NIFS-20-20]|uniref:hypothetical protein n=1 Tax=Shewanella sp. NIFS-20-20 TaxID=2853806 RepID=UPI001C45E1C9|nr:hypothetical protein [Shewanella sp. NIFS-20-20]MBV7314461.1 hypothetical protein [Shewanella sp. NIFS-20-20]